jgi:hypothetical protein
MLVASASVAAFLVLTRGAPDTATEAHAATKPAPTPSDFAHTFAGTANAYATAHGSRSRITHVHCVQGSPGRYMCSYAVVRPRQDPECHLMQARWTPGELSSFEVTLSGRTARCGSLREAIRSLR